MRRSLTVWFAVAMLLVLPGVAGAQEKAGAKTLKVKLSYTGTGTVDEKHKIHVMVVDSDPFVAEVLAEAQSADATKPRQPKTAYILAKQGLAEKNGVLTFAGLNVSLVYVMAFFDQAGTYESTHGPASGSPMGMYFVVPGKPEPVKLKDGKTAEVKVTFDDAQKTP